MCSGDSYTVFDLLGCRCAILICYGPLPPPPLHPPPPAPPPPAPSFKPSCCRVRQTETSCVSCPALPCPALPWAQIITLSRTFGPSHSSGLRSAPLPPFPLGATHGGQSPAPLFSPPPLSAPRLPPTAYRAQPAVPESTTAPSPHARAALSAAPTAALIAALSEGPSLPPAGPLRPARDRMRRRAEGRLGHRGPTPPHGLAAAHTRAPTRGK